MQLLHKFLFSLLELYKNFLCIMYLCNDSPFHAYPLAGPDCWKVALAFFPTINDVLEAMAEAEEVQAFQLFQA